MVNPRLAYRVTCAREELERAATAVTAASQWLIQIQDRHLSDVRYETGELQEILKHLAVIDLKLQDLI